MVVFSPGLAVQEVVQNPNRVLVLRVGAVHEVVIRLLNNYEENRNFSGLLCVEMAFVNLTSIIV